VLHIGTEFQYQIKDATGAIIWQGAAVVGVDYRVKNTDAAAIVTETAIKVDGPGTTIGQAFNPTTSDPLLFLLAGKAVAAAADAGFLGVSLEPIAVNGFGLVGGPGTVCSVRVTSVAITVGTPIVGSATAGLCTAAAVKSATAPAYGTVVGMCIKAAAQQGATGNYFAGILVTDASS